jgi:glycosyltransferase involved in cell wall biosynthesis
MTTTDPRPLVVVPCYNEAARLDLTRFAALAESGRVRLLFVDDGSTDDTGALLRRLGDLASVDVVRLPHNVGKAEAIRRGLLQGLGEGASTLGYLDADLATPPGELLRMLDLLESRPDLSFVLASRVALLGRRIARRARRHYLGRVFATFASIFLRIPVYDTQCGAKVFRASPAIEAALATPFRSSWVFDVELIGRLLGGSSTVDPVPLDEFEEMPLREWHDVSGSRLGLGGMARAAVDLAVVGYRLNRPRRAASVKD